MRYIVELTPNQLRALDYCINLAFSDIGDVDNEEFEKLIPWIRQLEERRFKGKLAKIKSRDK